MLDQRALRVKRWMDVVIGSITLLAVLPIGLLIAASVKLTSRGPAFFVQERVGKNGVPFRLIKFRTMRDGTHQEVLNCDQQRAQYTANDFKLPPDDPRITKVGQDPSEELARRGVQVSQRATRSDESCRHPTAAGRRSGAAAGVRSDVLSDAAARDTGLWQVEGRSTIGAHDRMALDREYVETWNLAGDAKLLLLTPLAVLHLHHAH